MTFEVRLGSIAESDFDRLVGFLLPKSAVAAISARHAIFEGARSLADLPNRGRAINDRGLRELVVTFGRDAFLLRYRVVGDAVLITRILHSREAR